MRLRFEKIEPQEVNILHMLYLKHKEGKVDLHTYLRITLSRQSIINPVHMNGRWLFAY